MTGPGELRRWLTERIAGLTGVAPEHLDARVPLAELGLSSRDAVTVAAELGERLGREPDLGLLGRHPSIAALVTALAGPDTRPRTAEPVAVLGIGCRLPGGIESADQLWHALLTSTDVTGPPPDPRPGDFLSDVNGFDAAFFGFDAAEAAAMDPRRRILLETTWAALEHAGIAPGTLRGSRTGVFVGASAADHALFAASMIANGVSERFDLRGPSVVVDTAGSSALVAVHQAVRALAAGEADLTLAAGVQVLSPPPRDGTVYGEGCGVVVLKRLTDARRDADRVLAVIRGSATGWAAQDQILADAHAVAGSSLSTVDYVETQGGSAEAQALARNRSLQRPMLVGSMSGSFGDLGAASGIVGLIKVVLALWHDRLPPSRGRLPSGNEPATGHDRFAPSPGPLADAAELATGRARLGSAPGRDRHPRASPGDSPRLSPVDKSTGWPRYAGTARAGVSASGAGGSGAHVVVEEWPKPLEPATPGSRWNGRPQVFTVSARSESALRRRAGDLADWLAGPGRVTAPGDLAAALARRREHLPLRAAVVTSSRAALVAGLRALADGGTTKDVVRGTAGQVPPRPVFVFSGAGAQWPAMGRRMLGAEPEFRAAVGALEPLFLAKAGFSLRGALRRPFGDPAVVPPLVFGLQVALAGWWRAHGVEPAAVLGHSAGEIAAAVVAGALDAGAGLDIVVSRANLLSQLPAGTMAVVELSAAEVRALDFPGITVVEHASPAQCTVAGTAEDLAVLVSHVDGLGRWARRLAGTANSAAVETILDRFRAGLGDLRPRPPETAYYTSVLDDPRATPAFDAGYWMANLRRPVRFTQAVAAAVADGHRWFVEVSPHPIALPAVEQTAGSVRTLPTLSRRDGEENAFARSLAELHTAGHPAVLDRRYPEAPVLDLPPPPWERRTFRPRPAGHPLPGARVEVPDEGRHLWQTTIAPEELDEHRVHDVPVFPAAGFLELVLAGARERFGTGSVRVDGLEVHRMLAVTGETVLSTEIRDDGAAVVRAKAGASWVRHATAWVSADTEPAPAILSEVDERTRPIAPKSSLAGTLAATLPEGSLPDGFGRVRLLGDPGRGVRCLADDAGTVQLVTRDGEVVADFRDIRLQAPGTVPLAARAFGITWPRTPLPPVPSGRRNSWLLLTDEHPAALGRAVALALALAAAGDEALSLPQDDLDELPAFLAERPVRGVVFLTGAPHAYRDPEDAQDLLRTVRSVLARLAFDVRFHLVTQSSGEPGLAFLRGLVRVLAFERPELRATLVDCDARSEVDVLARELRSGAPDDEVRWRRDVRYAARLTRVPLVDGVSTGPGAYVVTGARGSATARWLAGNGATRIVLCGLSGDDIGLSGVDVVVVAGDIAEPGVAEQLVAAATADGLPLRGIVHAAGDDVASLWRSKVLGARRLHDATADAPPDWWLLYSSSASLIGAPGRTALATADAWLDAFATWRRTRGLPATTVNWGADPVLDPMPVAEALEALPAVLAADRSSVGIARLDAGRVAGRFPELGRRPFFSAVLPAVPVPETAHERLTTIVARLLGDAVPRDVPLVELGLDSLTAMRARAAAEREFGVTLPVPLLLGGANLNDLAEYVTGTRAPVATPDRRPGIPPLVLFGESMVYRPLLDRLEGVPCRGVEASDVEGCVASLREVQPSGPYRLGGWAAGGVLAFETARRLAASGERVDVVVLFDSEAPLGAEPYAGRVVLYQAGDAAVAGWAACCADLHVETVPGDHRTMLDPPHVAVPARLLTAELAGRTSPGITPV
ncbi:acyltransferase domain-containing protein [Amycolatopsis sp. NPDC005961]|uniref:acyltransferase domain-containing protein n=1 Tax=Amycolatopsis sp. NPDC005961 TaxID=3156720 RepID=UPI0033E53F45